MRFVETLRRELARTRDEHLASVLTGSLDRPEYAAACATIQTVDRIDDLITETLRKMNEDDDD